MVSCSRSDCDDASAVEISLSIDLCAGSRARVLLWAVSSLGAQEEEKRGTKKRMMVQSQLLGFVFFFSSSFLSLSVFMKEIGLATP